jgi:hypothetical protein
MFQAQNLYLSNVEYSLVFITVKMVCYFTYVLDTRVNQNKTAPFGYLTISNKQVKDNTVSK